MNLPDFPLHLNLIELGTSEPASPSTPAVLLLPSDLCFGLCFGACGCTWVHTRVLLVHGVHPPGRGGGPNERWRGVHRRHARHARKCTPCPPPLQPHRRCHLCCYHRRCCACAHPHLHPRTLHPHPCHCTSACLRSLCRALHLPHPSASTCALTPPQQQQQPTGPLVCQREIMPWGCLCASMKSRWRGDVVLVLQPVSPSFAIAQLNNRTYDLVVPLLVL